MDEISKYLDTLRALADANVEFVVIGQVAAALHGSSIPTKDIDVCYRRSPDNVRRLVDALRKLNARLRVGRTSQTEADAPPFQLDERAIQAGGNFTFETDFGPLDCLAWPAGVNGFEELRERAAEYDLDGVTVLAASIDDMLLMKRKAGRPRDVPKILELEEIKRIQESGEAP